MKTCQPEQWTEQDVKQALTNPFYTGIGPFPAIVTEDQFVEAGQRLIGEMGAEAYLRQLVKTIRDTVDAKHFHLDDGTVLVCDREDEHMHCNRCGKAYGNTELLALVETEGHVRCDCGEVFEVSENDDGDDAPDSRPRPIRH